MCSYKTATKIVQRPIGKWWSEEKGDRKLVAVKRMSPAKIDGFSRQEYLFAQNYSLVFDLVQAAKDSGMTPAQASWYAQNPEFMALVNRLSKARQERNEITADKLIVETYNLSKQAESIAGTARLDSDKVDAIAEARKGKVEVARMIGMFAGENVGGLSVGGVTINFNRSGTDDEAYLDADCRDIPALEQYVEALESQPAIAAASGPEDE